jgi:hypothetical protein
MNWIKRRFGEKPPWWALLIPSAVFIVAALVLKW